MLLHRLLCVGCEGVAGRWALPALGNAGKSLDGRLGLRYRVGMQEPQLVTLQDRKRANLARVASHDQYLVHTEADGTMIWEPATVITEAEKRLLAQPGIVDEITANRADPSRLRKRSASTK